MCRVTIIKIEEEEIAFGAKILKVHLTMPEEIEGGTSEIEEIVRGIPGIEEVEVAYVTRML